MKKSYFTGIVISILFCIVSGLSAEAAEKAEPVLNAKGKQVVVAIDAGHQAKANTGTEAIGPGSRQKK